MRSQAPERERRHRAENPDGAWYGETRTRTGDTTIFSRVLYQLSYLAVAPQTSVRGTGPGGAQAAERDAGDRGEREP